jgi:peroxiredoxin
MITTGDTVPDIELRTDEGTPLALTDLKGRALCLFLLGAAFTPTVERLLDLISKNIGRFLSLNASPIAVFGDSVDSLAEHRAEKDAPFILISDESFALHDRFRGKDDNLAAVWIINEAGVVLDIVPMLPPTELLGVTLDRTSRALGVHRQEK